MEHLYLDKKGGVIDFYAIFNLSHDAGADDIKAAFRNLIKMYHPDTANGTESSTAKIELIMRGYRILIDEQSRREYDRALAARSNVREDGLYIIPKKRIHYSVLLGDMLKKRFLPKGMKRGDILNNFGQDIEIILTPLEAKNGAVAYIELPAKMQCPTCQGRDHHCTVCRGIGRIGTSAHLEVRIPPGTDDATFIDYELTKVHPDPLTNFSRKSLRLKISIKK